MIGLKKGKSICIFSAKGGVGKTTFTLNLAGIYQTIGKKVLIIDLDLFSGGIGVSLNLLPKKTIYNLSEDLNNNNYTVFEDYTEKYSDFISIISSPKDPRQVNKIDKKFIDLVIERATHIYDIVLIDTTHQLNETNIIALDKVDNTLFMITKDPVDLKNIKSVISIFDDLEFKNYKVLLNNSRDPYKNYFTLYDIKSIIKTNIDYTLSSSFFIKDIDSYVMNGKIITLEPKISSTFAKDYNVIMQIALDFYSEKGGEKND